MGVPAVYAAGRDPNLTRVKNVKKTLLIAGAVSLLVSAQADAACSQANAKGKWTMYQSVMTKIEAAQSHIGRCDIEVKTNQGDYAGSCWTKGGMTMPDFPVTGKMTVNADCTADMTMDSAGSTYKLSLSPNKQMFRGWFTNSYGVYGTTNAVKR